MLFSSLSEVQFLKSFSNKWRKPSPESKHNFPNEWRKYVLIAYLASLHIVYNPLVTPVRIENNSIGLILHNWEEGKSCPWKQP